MLKQVQRPAKVSWGPVKQCSTLLAAGGVGVNFEKSQLEIYDVNLSDTSRDMTLLGSVQTPDCFQSIAWGAKGIEDRTLSHGIVAGGMSDGSINFWNAGAIISRKTDSILSRAAGHKSPVLDMSFHPAQVNLLASASASGEVFVWDIQQPSAPTFSNDHQKDLPGSTNGVCALDWNWKVHRILASANDVGETTIWDLRQKKGIISLKQHYSKHRGARQRDRATGLAWQPGKEVNVAVSYQSPVIEIWDMRYAQGPKVQLEGAHSSSVLGIDWCPHDSSLLLSTGDDGRTFVWDAMQGQVLCEYASEGVNSDIDYSPFLPGIVSTCNYDGMISLYSYNHTGPNHVPKWLGTNAGSSIGFGGKVVSFGLDNKLETTEGKQPLPSPSNAPISKQIHVDQITSEPLLTQLSNQFLQQMQYGDWSTFCDEKMATATDEAERSEWKFMKILLAEDKKSQCTQLVLELGFQAPIPEEETKEAEHQQQHQQQYQQLSPHEQRQQQQQQPALTIHAPPDYSENDESFFDNFVVPEQPVAAAVVETKNNDEIVQTLLASEKSKAVVEADAESEEDDTLRRALIVGDWKGAVARAIELDRIADALIFSSCAGLALWESTRALFFKKHAKPFVRNVVKLVIGHDLTTLVQESDLKKWKETLAILLTYSTGEERDGLVNALAYRLETQQDLHAALLCYLCSSNIDRVVSIWSRPPTDGKQQKEGGVVGLHHVIEKITVLAQAIQSSSSPLLAAKYCEYAALLASQGCLPAAITFLNAAKADDECNAVLRDRLFRAQPAQYQNPAQAPHFPFHMQRVGVDPSQAQALAADAHQRAQAELYKQQQQYQATQPPQTQPIYAPVNPGMDHRGVGGGGVGGGGALPPHGVSSPPGRRASVEPQPDGRSRFVSGPYANPNPNAFPTNPNPNPYPANPNPNPYPTNPNPNPYPTNPNPNPYPTNPNSNPYPANPNPNPYPTNPNPNPYPANPNPNPYPTNPNPTPYHPNPSNQPYRSEPAINPGSNAPFNPYATGNAGFGAGNTNFAKPVLAPNAGFDTPSPVPPSDFTRGPGLPPRPGANPVPALPSRSLPPAGGPPADSRRLPPNVPLPHNTPSNYSPAETYIPPTGNQVSNTGFPSGAPSFTPAPALNPPTPFAPRPLAPALPQPTPAPSRPVAQTQKVPLPHPRPVGPSAGGDGRAMAATLNQLADQLEADPSVKPVDKKKLPEVRKRLGDLSSRIEANALTPNALGLLNTLVQAMNDGNMLAAQQAHTKLVTDEFKDNQFWLPGVKTLMLMFKKR